MEESIRYGKQFKQISFQKGTTPSSDAYTGAPVFLHLPLPAHVRHHNGLSKFQAFPGVYGQRMGWASAL